MRFLLFLLLLLFAVAAWPAQWRYVAQLVAFTGEVRTVNMTTDPVATRHEYEVFHVETGDLELAGELVGGATTAQFDFTPTRVGHYKIRVRSCNDAEPDPCSEWTDSDTPQNVVLPADAPPDYNVGWLIFAWIAGPQP